jgi:hypothetical protein
VAARLRELETAARSAPETTTKSDHRFRVNHLSIATLVAGKRERE